MATEKPAPWDSDDPAWAELIAAGVDPEDAEVRRYGVLRVIQASRRLEDAVWEVAAHWATQLGSATVDDHREAFEMAREKHVYPELKEAYDAFFQETRRAMGILDADPRFSAALDATRTGAS